MRIALAIARREISGWFASPIAFVLLGAFAFLYGYFFSDYLRSFVEAGMRMGGFSGGALNVNSDLIRWLMASVAVLWVFLTPIVTMRSLAAELRSGTAELLLTAPVTDGQIVFGKFLAVFALFAAMLGITGFHTGILFWHSMPDIAPVLSAYLGLLLLSAAFGAIGLFFSSLTRSQIVAGMLTLLASLVLWLLEFTGPEWGGTGRVLAYLSVTGHTADFTRGVISTRDIVFYLSFTAFWLFLTRESIRSRRWRG